MKHTCVRQRSSDLAIRGSEAFPGGNGGCSAGSTALPLHGPPTRAASLQGRGGFIAAGETKVCFQGAVVESPGASPGMAPWGAALPGGLRTAAALWGEMLWTLGDDDARLLPAPSTHRGSQPRTHSHRPRSLQHGETLRRQAGSYSPSVALTCIPALSPSLSLHPQYLQHP